MNPYTLMDRSGFLWVWVWVALPTPGGIPMLFLHLPEDDGCLADTSDIEGGSFQITSILDYQIDDFSDVATSLRVHPCYRQDGSG